MSVGPVRKITSTYPNTRSYAKYRQIPRPARMTIITYHCANDSNGIGNEVLRKSQYDGRTFIVWLRTYVYETRSDWDQN